jgi:hypothetical protein
MDKYNKNKSKLKQIKKLENEIIKIDSIINKKIEMYNNKTSKLKQDFENNIKNFNIITTKLQIRKSN